MTAEPQTKTYCLFHQKSDCICIAPVTDQRALKDRLENAITNNELNNRFATNEEQKAARETENEDFRRRLTELTNK